MNLSLAKSIFTKWYHVPAYSALAVLGVIVTEDAHSGQYAAVAAAQREVGCIDGQCDSPITPFGHYQGSWRRWPFSKDTPVPKRSLGITPVEPIVPDAIDEVRTRQKTRSDRPMDPEDMGVGAGADTQPLLPGPTESANPFNNTVEESDIPAPTNGFDAPANDVADPLFPPAPGNANEADNGVGDLFDIPADPPADPAVDEPGFDDGGDLFDQSGLFPPPPTKSVRILGARSIKSRGVNLQVRGKLTTSPTARPATARELEMPAIVTSEPRAGAAANTAKPTSENAGELDLVSYDAPSEDDAWETLPEESEAVSKLSETQLEDAQQIPTESTPRRNPLRRGSSSRPASDKPEPTPTVKATSLADETDLVEDFELADPESSLSEIPQPNLSAGDDLDMGEIPQRLDTPTSSRVLSQAVASRSLRDTIRKNPLR